MTHTPGKIFLADRRSLTETPRFRRHSTFDSGKLHPEHQAPIGSLVALHEEVLAGLQVMEMPVDQPTHLVLLPVTGAVEFHDPHGNITTVSVEEVLIADLPALSIVKVKNPYESDLISYIQIWIKADRPLASVSARLLPFQVGTNGNQLAGIDPAKQASGAPQLPFSFCIGRFDGRQEAVYQLKSKDSLFFAFVIAGAFECAGRLLQEKDGLALWDAAAVELEALSNNALVLAVELVHHGQQP